MSRMLNKSLIYFAFMCYILRNKTLHGDDLYNLITKLPNFSPLVAQLLPVCP